MENFGEQSFDDIHYIVQSYFRFKYSYLHKRNIVLLRA